MKNVLLKGEKPDFNNPEHIKKLQQHLKYEKELLDDHVFFDDDRVSVEVKVTINFPCAECVHEVNFWRRFENVKSFDIDEHTNDREVKCDNCGCVYTFVYGVITMTKNPKYPHKINDEIEPPEDNG